MSGDSESSVETRFANAVIDLCSRNRSPSGGPARYRVHVSNVSPDRSAFDLTVTFLAGETYCCTEPGCHFGYYRRDWWRRLHGALASHGLDGLPPLTIRSFRGIVEAGAWCTYGEEPKPQDASEYTDGPWHERNAVSVSHARSSDA